MDEKEEEEEEEEAAIALRCEGGKEGRGGGCWFIPSILFFSEAAASSL